MVGGFAASYDRRSQLNASVRPLPRSKRIMGSDRRPSRGRVEDLLAEVSSVDGTADVGTPYELWVPEVLTLHGTTVQSDLAMAIVVDALLAKSYYPHGFEAAAGGRVYRYVREA
jgi:hypothetical protein